MESPPPSDTGRPAIPIRHNQPNTPPSTHYIRPEQVARKIEASKSPLLVQGYVTAPASTTCLPTSTAWSVKRSRERPSKRDIDSGGHLVLPLAIDQHGEQPAGGDRRRRRLVGERQRLFPGDRRVRRNSRAPTAESSTANSAPISAKQSSTSSGSTCWGRLLSGESVTT